MRLFVAARPTTPAVVAIDRLPRPEAPGVRWLPAEQWHVTLRFLGEADPEVVSAALAGLSAVPVEAVLGPSTLLLGDTVLVAPVAGLDGLAAAVAAVTAGVGEPPEDRPFFGHITLSGRRSRRRSRLTRWPWSGVGRCQVVLSTTCWNGSCSPAEAGSGVLCQPSGRSSKTRQAELMQ